MGNFRVVRSIAQRKGKCPVCGKQSTRNGSFTQTVNPYNRNPDGTVKTAREIYAELRIEASDWVPDFTHQKCAPRDEAS